MSVVNIVLSMGLLSVIREMAVLASGFATRVFSSFYLPHPKDGGR